jgi:hypothetical protein
MLISITLSLKINGPWDTPVNPEQLICVGVMLGVMVGSGVLDGVKVNVGGSVLVGDTYPGVFMLPAGGVLVNVEVQLIVGVKVAVFTKGIRDGVLDSAAKPVGSADPKIGMEIRKERALADTIFIGSIGMIEMIGSYIAET